MAVLGVVRSCVYRFRQRYFPPKMVSYPFSYAMLTDIGRARTGNEDACGASPTAGAFVVCDGMGGAAAGEVASALASQTFLQTLTDNPAATPEARLEAAVAAANDAVYQQAHREPGMKGMGTTLVALLLENSALTLAHVGDSRCYLFRAEALTQLSNDHSLVAEQLRMGQITPAQAEVHPLRNIITRVIGSQTHVQPDIAHLDPQPGDLYLIASDGLSHELSNPEIADVFTQHPAELDLSTLCQALIDRANEAGGRDNITVLLLHLP